MSPDEAKLLLTLPVPFLIFRAVFGATVRRSVVLFILAGGTGFLAQIPLGPELNRYTPNITVYIFHVSLAVTITWGIGLTSVYLAQLRVARLLRITPGLGLYCTVAAPILILIELIGSNFIHMKLHNFAVYDALIPHAMNAPPWLYGYYAVIATVFYFGAQKLDSKSGKSSNAGASKTASEGEAR